MKEYTTAEIFEELWKRIEYDANVSEELASESNELQERIDKAIEYIEHLEWIEMSFDILGKERIRGTQKDFVNDLLEILKGENDDNNCDSN